MRFLVPLTVYCISLVSLQQLQALPVEERPDGDSLDLLSNLISQKEDKILASESQPTIAATSSAPSHSPKWLQGFLKHGLASGVRTASPRMQWLTKVLQLKEKVQRVRRHVRSGSRGGHHYNHAQLMRVGCVLGTCQVQNLSHRLYQLIGQSGREDSSPINPRSPHSYG